MKCQGVLSACLLLLWTLTASVSCDGDKTDITVKTVSDGIELSCGEDNTIKAPNGVVHKKTKLPYKDEFTGEYTCVRPDPAGGDAKEPKIYVKFRSCDNCIELDLASIAGIVVGNVVATTGIGVAVYLIASQTRSGPTTSHKKSSDRQHLVSNEMSNRASNDLYQPLRPRNGQKDTYDELNHK